MIRTVLVLVFNLATVLALLAATVVTLITLAAIALAPMGHEVNGIDASSLTAVALDLVAIAAALAFGVLVGKLHTAYSTTAV